MKLKKFLKNTAFVIAVFLAWGIVISSVSKLIKLSDSSNDTQSVSSSENVIFSNSEIPDFSSEYSFQNSDSFEDGVQNNQNAQNASSSSQNNHSIGDFQNQAIPLNSSKESIINFYNKIINELSTASVTVTKTQFSKIKITDYPAVMKSMIEQQKESMENSEPLIITKAFTNGKSQDGTALSELLPNDSTKTILTYNAVTNASCDKTENGYKIVLQIIDEETDNIQKMPDYHAQCMDSVGKIMKTYIEEYQKENPPAESVTPPSAPETPNENADWEGSMKMKYHSGSITAYIDANGKLQSLDIKMPVNMFIKMKMALWSMEMTGDINLDQTYEFKY